MPLKIGFDLDNTIINYDRAFHELACENGWIQHNVPVDKVQVQQHIRQLADGQNLWEQAQAMVYGPRIQRSTLNEGVTACLHELHECGHQLCIISHKTQVSPHDPLRTDLRASAIRQLAHLGVLEIIHSRDVYFESTRALKVQRIRAERCQVFIDDLRETFLEPEFPAACVKLLFAPGRQYMPKDEDVLPCTSFADVLHAIAD